MLKDIYTGPTFKVRPYLTFILFSFTNVVVSTHLKKISQIGSIAQVGVKIKNPWNHDPAIRHLKQTYSRRNTSQGHVASQGIFCGRQKCRRVRHPGCSKYQETSSCHITWSHEGAFIYWNWIPCWPFCKIPGGIGNLLKGTHFLRIMQDKSDKS